MRTFALSNFGRAVEALFWINVDQLLDWVRDQALAKPSLSSPHARSDESDEVARMVPGSVVATQALQPPWLTGI
jgi:hypothetical protein